MTHDYIDTIDNFYDNFKGKIWDWHEIKYDDIKETVEEYNLVPYMNECFANIAWGCFVKE